MDPNEKLKVVLDCIADNGGIGGQPNIDSLIAKCRKDPGSLSQSEFFQLQSVHLAYFYPVDMSTWTANEDDLWNCIADGLGFTAGPPVPGWFNQGVDLGTVIA